IQYVQPAPLISTVLTLKGGQSITNQFIAKHLNIGYKIASSPIGHDYFYVRHLQNSNIAIAFHL
ncbi:hypothetical protein, partial [Methylobacter sp.]|uniref:hypothetical protein n=1 Tax=Methylobacter sp. TaxID=2051955 RepID=UPI002488AD18